MADTTLIFTAFSEPVWHKTCLYLTEYIERRLSVPTILLHGGAFEDFAVQAVDAGFVDTLSYLQLLGQDPCSVELVAIPVPRDAALDGSFPAFLDIVVHQESALNSLGDLQDCTRAYHERASHVEDHFLDKQGLLALNGKEVVETSSQARALRLVLDKKAEVTAIDARLLDLVRRNSPAMAARLRVVSTCCYSPGPLVVVAAGLDAALKQEIHKAFLTVHLDQFFVHRLHEGAIERFVSASNKQYHRVRRWYERSGRLLASVPVAKLQAEARIPASLS